MDIKIGNPVVDEIIANERFEVYPESVNVAGSLTVFMARGADADFLVAVGSDADKFDGEVKSGKSAKYVIAPLTHKNANVLKELFAFTKPIRVLGKKRSFGVGDRLGIAAPGHIRVFKDYDASPVLAQQSIRELFLTERTYEDVLDAATFYVFRDGYKNGYGADGDHLKTEKDIEYALSLGFTMLTLDCSEHIRNDVEDMPLDKLNAELPEIPEYYKNAYLGKEFKIENSVIKFDEEYLKRTILIYREAVDFAVHIYNKYLAGGKYDCDFEISIDETATPTSPEQHFFVANELTAKNVKINTVAPRFCGEFQKGIDYIGDIAQFERELIIHAAIARHFGYKLSIHSGSDKFATFKLIGKYTNGNFHVKTAGTNWLEGMRAVAAIDPTLYREIHAYALSMFNEAKKYYHVTTDLTKIPDISTLKDEELVNLFNLNDARQLIHITYGFILTDKKDGEYIFKNRLYKLWRDNEQVYSDMLYKHIGKHLSLLYSGFTK